MVKTIVSTANPPPSAIALLVLLNTHDDRNITPPMAMVTKKAPKLNSSNLPKVTLVKAGGMTRKQIEETIDVAKNKNNVELTKNKI